MLKQLFTCLLLLLIVNFNVSSQTAIISGKISDANSGEYLPLATIYSAAIEGGTSSNLYGFYSLKLPKGKTKIEFSYVGYKKQVVNINLQSDTTFNIQLEPNIELSEVNVFAENNQSRLKSTKVSTHVITAKSLEQLPTLLGETDIIKTLRTLPGVNAAAEGASGLVVRGGGPDENLVLYDGVPIYNINHLNGFFSVFNTDAIASAEMYKGAYPARYGGRISSVVDVRMREGNLKKFSGKISVGTIASKLTLEGPLIQNKSSFIVSARRTYLDLFTLPAQHFLDPTETNNYIFDDYNAKVNYVLNSKNRVYLSAYLGKDKFYIKSKYIGNTARRLEQMDWGNAFVSSRWNSELSSSTFLNVTAYYYRYKYEAEDGFIRYATGEQLVDESRNEQQLMHMKDWGLTTDFDFNLNNVNHIRYGGQFIYHSFLPNDYSNYRVNVYKDGYHPNYTYKYDTINESRTLGRFESVEGHAYIEDEITIGALFKLNAGVHYSVFSQKTELFHYLMPRISMVYMPTEQLSLKLSGGQYSQYSFLVTNPTIGMPTDIWTQSIKGLRPMKGWQTVLGAMYNMKNNLLLNCELFYKQTQNVTEFKEMVQFNIFNNWDEILEQGLAQNYGFETMIEQKTNKYNFKLSYAFTRAIRKFENLNNGNPFYYSLDAPHNINIEGNIKLGKKADLGVAWTYASGKRVTLVEQQYLSSHYFEDQSYIPFYDNSGQFISYGGEAIQVAPERNNHRLPAYHRLDIGINFTKQKKRGVRTWSYGIYNAYYRKNVFYIENWGDNYQQFSTTPIIPYVSYSYKF